MRVKMKERSMSKQKNKNREVSQLMMGEPRRSEDYNLFSLPDNILGFLCSWWLSVNGLFFHVALTCHQISIDAGVKNLRFHSTISLDDALYAIRKHCNQELRMLVITFRSKSVKQLKI
jgi:hypothetical protein